MKTSLLILVFLICIGKIKATGGWENVNPAFAVGKLLTRVYCIDANNAIVVGDSGFVAKTTDGAKTWQQSTALSTYTLNDVFFLNTNKGFIIGNQGKLFRTLDAGQHWISVPIAANDSAHTPNLLGIHFFDSNNGIIVGDAIVWHTIDGGESWWCIHATNGLLSTVYYMIYMSSPTAWLIGDSDGYFYHTSDAGNNWTKIDSGIRSTDEEAALYSFSFFDNNSAIAVGRKGSIVRTTTGGNSWQPQSQNLTNTLYDVDGGDAIHVTAVGANGSIVRTNDGGETWTTQQSGTMALLFGVSFADANNGFAVGENGTILHTSTGGSLTSVEQSQPLLEQGLQLWLSINLATEQIAVYNTIAKRGVVRIELYDMLGRCVAYSNMGAQESGEYSLSFSTHEWARGFYIVRLSCDEQAKDVGVMLQP